MNTRSNVILFPVNKDTGERVVLTQQDTYALITLFQVSEMLAELKEPEVEGILNLIELFRARIVRERTLAAAV